MKAALRSISKHALAWALTIFAIAIWLGADALFGGQPTDTNALQASADLANDLAAETVARKGTP